MKRFRLYTHYMGHIKKIGGGTWLRRFNIRHDYNTYEEASFALAHLWKFDSSTQYFIVDYDSGFICGINFDKDESYNDRKL